MPSKLEIVGDVSVEQCESALSAFRWCILILGPTGAGKSSFIEALAGKGQSLGISKDQLARFTQEVTAYKVKNAIVQEHGYTHTLYLIDAPGFSNSKISELEIITKVKQWMNDQGVEWINGVLYLSPITDTRAPGSKWRTIKMIQTLLYNKAFDRLNIVTTMWDRLSYPQAEKCAETNFAQLQDDIWKEYKLKYTNINHYGWAPLGGNPIESEDASALLLYKELLDHISNAQQERKQLQQKKIDLITNPDPLLESDVLSRLPEVKDNLSEFLGQLVALGRPPPRFEGVIPERCVYQSLLDEVNEAWEEQAALQATIACLHVNPDQEQKAMLNCKLGLVKHEIIKAGHESCILTGTYLGTRSYGSLKVRV
ncbi:hypothetical protein BJ165DRAFT_1529867 [Panaeolus papilionaceus]|nr:hypothetical protein BJ165DRAFT_1529867 [Panaeolus papilionaceus]